VAKFVSYQCEIERRKKKDELKLSLDYFMALI